MTMAAGNSEIKTYFGRCRCCLNYGYLKNMWEEHSWEGEKEIYVEMLVQCFALSWEHTEDSMEHDQICESCIKSLRDATSFKKVVLESQEELLKEVDEGREVPIKIEEEDEEGSYVTEDKEGLESEGVAEAMYVYEDDPDDPDDPGYGDNHDPDPDDEASEMEYEEVEYLDDEDNKEALAAQIKPQNERRAKTRSEIPPDKKWPRKLPKSERYKTYKQYTEEDLRKCVEAIRNEEMTPQEASEKYNIPKKTICAKVKMDPKDQQTNSHKAIDKEKMFQLIQELKVILTYTNATPYKSKANKYFCAYCPEGPPYEEPDDLRTHTRTDHVIDRTQKIEYAMRPHWMNETIKLDIENLLCNVCCIPISNWNDMFRHLKEQHSIILDQAYTRAIPYVLKNELSCALCKETFTNYMHLDGHMNAHYNNYVCDDCGDTFLAANRLKQHIKIHDVGKFPCSMCAKVFSLEKYKKKHEELVHKQLSKYKCWYCDERFSGEYMRHLHIVDKHNEKVKTYTCEFCGQTFNWRPYYITHKRKKHSTDSKKFACQICGKKYFLQFELKEHLLSHSGVKNYPCSICNKRYVSAGSLKQHMIWHKKNDGVDL